MGLNLVFLKLMKLGIILQDTLIELITALSAAASRSLVICCG